MKIIYTKKYIKQAQITPEQQQKALNRIMEYRKQHQNAQQQPRPPIQQQPTKPVANIPVTNKMKQLKPGIKGKLIMGVAQWPVTITAGPFEDRITRGRMLQIEEYFEGSEDVSGRLVRIYEDSDFIPGDQAYNEAKTNNRV